MTHVTAQIAISLPAAQTVEAPITQPTHKAAQNGRSGTELQEVLSPTAEKGSKSINQSLKLVQVNLGRRYAAQKECLAEAAKRKIGILMTQEPYVGAKGYTTSTHRIIQKFSNTSNKPVKSAVFVIDQSIEIIENPDLVCENMVAMTVRINGLYIGIINVYLEKDKDISEDLLKITQLMDGLKVKDIIIGGDFNAKSPWWGCEAGDRRGSQVVEALAQLNLNVVNEGNTPTFHIFRRDRLFKSIIDVTLCSNDLLNRVKQWRVDPTFVNLSDHRAITFQVSLDKDHVIENVRRSTRRYNTSKADWASFATILNSQMESNGLTTEEIVTAHNAESLETLVKLYIECIHKACLEAIPEVPSTISLRKTVWWTRELTTKRREVIRSRNKIRHANPRRRPFIVEVYQRVLEEYKKLITHSIITGWRNFCARQDKETMWQSIYRVIRKCTKSGEDKLLRSPISRQILSPQDSTELLAETFYPLDDQNTDTNEQRTCRSAVKELVEKLGDLDHSSNVPTLFTREEIETVFTYMSAKKSPGEDGLTADICHKAYLANPQILLGLYNQCLLLAYFPAVWKSAVIRIIPKPSRDDYSIPKSYRPIGLLSVPGKILEKMFVNRIIWQLGKEGSLNQKQYGFMPQRSTEDALYDAVELIRAEVDRKRIVVAVSLDIEGAFDHAWWPAIIQQLARKEIDPSLIRLVTSYLSSRSVTLKYAGEAVRRFTNKGCIQGSTCGPLLWNVLLDSLLEETNNKPVYIQAFADDILLIGWGNTGMEIERKLNVALEYITMWGKRNKLRFAPNKTQTVIFTRKRKFDRPRLQMEGIELKFSESMKVLGLHVDKNLNFAKHLDQTTLKVAKLYKAISRSAKAQWGLNSEIVATIYTAVIEPTVLYAANVWGAKSHRVYMRKKLDKITRMFGLMVCKAHRTVSLMSCAVLAGILPLDLRAAEQRDIYKMKRSNPHPVLQGWQMAAPISPFSLPHPALRQRLTFDFVNSIAELEAVKSDWSEIYTDGSKIGGRVGAAATIWQNNAEMHFISMSLANHCSVFQAELVAIQSALEFIMRNQSVRKAHVFSDSRSALESIVDPNNLHPLASLIHTHICEIKKGEGDIRLYWIRAHRGIPGNERADELAKSAALNYKGVSSYDRLPLSSAKRLIRGPTLNAWQERYSTAATGTVTKAFFPDVQEAHKTLKKIRLDNTMSQLFTGHGGFKNYLHKFNLAPNPFCACDGITVETVKHVLVDCPRFATERLNCKHRMNRDIEFANLSILVNDEDCRTAFLDYAVKVVRRTARANGSTI